MEWDVGRKRGNVKRSGELVAAGHFHEDFFQIGHMAVHVAERTVLPDDDLGQFFPRIGAGFGPDGDSVPPVFRGFFEDDFLDGGDFFKHSGDFFQIAFKFKIDASGRAKVGGKVGRGIFCLDNALVNDDDLVANHFHFTEDVGGKDDRMFLGKFFDEFPDLADLVGVQSVSWFVENQKIGTAEQRIRKADALAISLGEGSDHFPVHVFQSATFQGLGDGVPDFLGRDALQPSPVFQIFGDALVIVKRDVFREIPQVFSCFQGLFHDIVSGDGGGASGRRKISRQHPERCGFTGAVGAKKPDDFSFVNGKCGILDCLETAKGFGEVVGFNHGC